MIKIKLEDLALIGLVALGLSRQPPVEQPQPTPSPIERRKKPRPHPQPELPYPHPPFIGIPPEEIPIGRRGTRREREKEEEKQPIIPPPMKPPVITPPYHRPRPPAPKPPIEHPIPTPPTEIPMPPRRKRLPPRRKQLPIEEEEEEQPKIPSPRPPTTIPKPPPPFRTIGEEEEQKMKYGIHDHTITFKITLLDYRGKPTTGTLIVEHKKYGEILRVRVGGVNKVVTAQLNPDVPESCYYSAQLIKRIIPDNPELESLEVRQVGLAVGGKYVLKPREDFFTNIVGHVNDTDIAVAPDGTIWLRGKSIPGYVVTYMILDNGKLVDVGQAKAWEEWKGRFWVKTWAKYKPGLVVRIRNYDIIKEVKI